METSQNTTPMKVTVGALSVAVLGGIGYYLSNNQTPAPTPLPVTSTETVTPTATTTGTPSATGTTTTSLYKDGTYTANGVYSSPAGKENMVITLDLKNDLIASATFVGKAENPASKHWQEAFAKGFKEKVVGKSVDSISLSIVGGASLTPKGFNDALEKIKLEAKA